MREISKHAGGSESRSLPPMKTLFLLSCLIPALLHAGTHTWSGAGANDLWSNATNWSAGGVPVAGEANLELVFPVTASSKTLIDNIPGLVVDVITLEGGGWSLHGQNGAVLTLSGERGYNFVTTNANFSPNAVQTSLPIVLAATSRFNTAANLDLYSVISGPGGLTSYGQLTLRGPSDNTYTGTTTIESSSISLQKAADRDCFAGPLVVNAGNIGCNADHQIPDTVPVTLSRGADISLGAYVEKIGPLTLDWGYIHADIGNSLLTLGGNVTAIGEGGSFTGHFSLGGAVRTFDVAADADVYVNATVSDLLAGPGGITKTGAGNLRLSAPNTFAGALTVQEGTCFAEDSAAFGGTSGGVVVWAGATLWMNSGSALAVGNETLALGGRLYCGENTSWSGQIILSGTLSSFDGSITINGPKIFTHTGVMGGSGKLTKKGSSVLVLGGSSSNNFSGGTKLEQGDVLFAKSSSALAIPGDLAITGARVSLLGSHQIADSAAVTMNYGILDLGSQSDTIGSLAGPFGEVKFSTGTLTTGGNNASTTFNGLLSGYGGTSLIKTGTGTFTLQNTVSDGGINTLTGGLAVNGGTLTLNNVHSGPVTVNAGGLLNGSGTVGVVTVNGGKVCLCSLKTAGLTVTGAASQVLTDIQGVTPGVNFGHLKVTGTVNLTGSTFAATLGYAPFTGSIYLLIDNDGTDAVTGTFNGVAEGGTVLLNGKTFSITYHGGDGNDVVLRFTGTGLAPPVITVFTSTAFSSPGTPMRHEHFEVLGPPGVLHQVQYSGDLQSWNPLAISGTPNAQGQLTLNFDFPDYSSLSYPLFYRVVVP